jgi:aldehyde dehydrogenase (NAD+)
MEQFYPETASSSKTGHYARLVTPQAFGRINNLLKGTKGTIAIGGETDESQKYMSPTIVKDVPFNDSLMSESVFSLYFCEECAYLLAREIFGPILPIVPVEDVDEAIAFVRAK